MRTFGPPMKPEMSILFIFLNHDENYLCTICGIQQLEEVEEIHQVFIFKLNPRTTFYDHLYTRDVKFFDACSIAFFKETDPNYLIFVSHEEIFRFNYTIDRVTNSDDENVRETVIKFKYTFADQPNFACCNADQTKMIVACQKDQILLVDLDNKTQIDLGSKLMIGNAKAISSYHGYFYILFNKKGNQIGYFLL